MPKRIWSRGGEMALPLPAAPDAQDSASPVPPVSFPPQRVLRLLLRLFLIALVLGGLVWLLRDEERFGERLMGKAKALLAQKGMWAALVGLVALSFANWALEARKWQLLARPIVTLGYWQAYRGVLSGLALGLVTPHGLGDYLGRIVQFDHTDRTK